MPFISTALAVGLGVAGAVTGGVASMKAAGTQADAAKSAAQLQHQDAQAALAFQQKQYDTQQANLQPWMTAGKGALSELTAQTSTPGAGLLAPWDKTFTAPTGAEAAATPGYQFTLNQGELALQNSAAARGGALSGGTAKDIAGYSEGLANTTYNDVFSRALTQYQSAFNTFETNQSNTYNRLAGIAGTGQTATTTAGQQGQAAANNVSSTLINSGQQVGNSLQNAGAATASGYVGVGNSLNSGIGGISGYLQFQQLLAAQKGVAGAGGQVGYTPGAPGIDQALV